MKVGHVYVLHTALARPKAKDKIALCICASSNLFFWINTKARPDGIGQFPLQPSDHPALTHNCFLDLTRLTTFPPWELSEAQERPCISKALAARLVAHLRASPPKTLPQQHIDLAIANLLLI